MNRHEGLAWAHVQAKLEAKAEKLWSLHEMETTGGEPDVVGMAKKRANPFFMIVPPRARKAAEVFATTAKRSSPGKNTNRQTTRWTWQRAWALTF